MRLPKKYIAEELCCIWRTLPAHFQDVQERPVRSSHPLIDKTRVIVNGYWPEVGSATNICLTSSGSQLRGSTPQVSSPCSAHSAIHGRVWSGLRINFQSRAPSDVPLENRTSGSTVINSAVQKRVAIHPQSPSPYLNATRPHTTVNIRLAIGPPAMAHPNEVGRKSP